MNYNGAAKKIWLLEVIPLTKSSRVLKDPLLYYSLENNFQEGSIILISLRRKIIPGVVWRCRPPQKMFLRQIGFQIQPIHKVVIAQSAFTTAQMKLADYLGNYYWISPGIFLQMMWPFKSALKSKKSIDKLLIQIGGLSTKQKKEQRLILFPQINQAQKFLETNSFNLSSIAIFHSGLKAKEIKNNWIKVKTGQAQTIIGARQAIFLPFTNLREIIVNESESRHYSSWDMWPHYSAKVTVGYLAKIFQAHLKFISEIPTINDYYLKQQKKLKLEIPPANSLSARSAVKIIDLQAELARGNFSILSRELEDKLAEIVNHQQQALLFLGRRGFSTIVVCQNCGHLFTCPQCGIPLTRHITKSADKTLTEKLVCHRCGWTQPKPKNCPICHSHQIRNSGSGTQKLEYILEKTFPGEKIARLDSDCSDNQITKTLNQFQQKKIRFLVTTQKFLSYSNLIIPQISLAAVVSADTFLSLPDFQAAEELFTLIQKIKRKLKPNQQFLIQTYSPQNKVIQWATNNQFEKFYQSEIESRRLLNYPPFALLTYLEFPHQNNSTSLQLAEQEKNRLESLVKQWKLSSIEILGPIIGNPPKQKGLFIWRLLIKAKNLSQRNQILSATTGKVVIQ